MENWKALEPALGVGDMKMRVKQLSLQALKQDGKVDGRSARWQKVPSFAKLCRQGSMGGSIRYRKSERPFSSQKAQHIVLKSDECTAGFNFTHPSVKRKLEELAQSLALRANLKLQKIAIYHNHIHILAHSKRRESYSKFLRSFSGVVAKRMKKWAQKRNINLKNNSFWSARPFTTLVGFGKHWKAVLQYIEKNRLEANGFAAYTERNHPIQKILQKIEERLHSISSKNQRDISS
jgi:REP element-mobilizing transposase RayT